MSNIVISLAAEYTGRKAFKEAEQNVKNLEKGAKKLAKALGYSLSTAAVVAFGKASVKAFAEDEKAAAQLANTVNNLGLAFANPQIATFIDNLSKSASISDDQLRPAFQALIQTTGSLAKSQELLSQSLEVSRATGVDLVQVSTDLAQAYVGNTKGLRKYNLGLTQAELKAASFADIQERLTKLFSGANARYLDTYAGKMEALSVAAKEAQEKIGKGLVDSFALLAGQDTNVQNVTDAIDKMATSIANATVGMGKLIAQFKGVPVISKLFEALSWSIKNSPAGLLFGAAEKAGATKQSTGFSFFGSPMETLQNQRNAAAQKAAEAAAAKRAKELVKASNGTTKALKDQAALKKAGSVFDLKQIQLVAALKGSISEEERKRLELMMALETQNVTEAQRLTLELQKSQAATAELAKSVANLATINPFAGWTVPSMPGSIDFGGNTIGSLVQGFTPPLAGTYGNAGTITDASSFAGVVSVQIDGKEIAAAVQSQTNSGNYTGFSRLGDWRTL